MRNFLSESDEINCVLPEFEVCALREIFAPIWPRIGVLHLSPAPVFSRNNGDNGKISVVFMQAFGRHHKVDEMRIISYPIMQSLMKNFAENS